MKRRKHLHRHYVHVYILMMCGVLILSIFTFVISRSIHAITFPEAQPHTIQPLEQTPSTSTSASIIALSQRPILFEPNLGQTEKGIDFIAHKGASVIAISATSLNSETITQRLIKANTKAKPEGLIKQASVTNYFIGNDPKKWQSNVPNYQKVSYQSVYPKIDLEYASDTGRLNYQFIVQPGGDSKKIELALDGASSVVVSENNIVVNTKSGTMTWEKLHAFQMIDGLESSVDASFVKKGKSGYGFEIGEYDPNLPLIIDPTLKIDASTFFGGTGTTDSAASLALDSQNNIYIVGATNSTNLPVSGAYQPALSGTQDGYIAKFNPTATTLSFSTYFGGSGSDQVTGIQLGSDGSIYIVGTTDSTNLPILNAHQGANAGSRDQFITKFDSNASTLLFSTYFGGTATESFGAAIQLDASDTVHLSGRTDSTNYPTLNPFQAANGGGADSTIAKFSSTGTLLYSTYIGGSGTDANGLLSLDSSGNMYMTGTTLSTNFPTMNPYQAARSGNSDIYLLKLNSAGSALVFSTYFGGTDDDQGSSGGNSPVIDSDGTIYVSGWTESTDLPTVNPFQAARAGAGDTRDFFVSKFSSNGSTLLYSTYLGGNLGDNAVLKTSVDSAGVLTILGQTVSTDMPVPNSIQSTFGGGAIDIYLARLKPGESTLRFGTYLGGTGNDLAQTFLIGSDLGIVLAGSTGSAAFPTTPGAFQPALSGTGDGFITKISFSDCPPCGGGSAPAPRIVVSAPNGFERFKAGDHTKIQWVSQNMNPDARIRLSLLLDSGKVIVPISANSKVSDEGYTWIVPTFEGTSIPAKIRLELLDASDNVVMFDDSDYYFDIIGVLPAPIAPPEPPTEPTPSLPPAQIPVEPEPAIVIPPPTPIETPIPIQPIKVIAPKPAPVIPPTITPEKPSIAIPGTSPLDAFFDALSDLITRILQFLGLR